MKNQKLKRKSNRVQRACFNCRKRKQGCEEERPCKRCVEKGLDCFEVEAKRKKGRRSSESSEPQASPNSSPVEMETMDHVHCTRAHHHPDISQEYLSDPKELILASEEEIPSPEPSFLLPLIPKQDSDYEAADSEPEETISEMKKRPLSINSVNGVNLALLLPLIWREICCNEEQIEYFRSFFLGTDMETTDTDLERELMSTEYPFYRRLSNASSDDFSDDRLLPVYEEVNPEDRAGNQMKESWKVYLEQIKQDGNLERELSHAKETWKEIMDGLRNSDWKKVQSCLQDMDPFQNDTKSPALVFWSSGGKIQYANYTFCSLVGYPMDELRADKIPAHLLFHPEETVKILSRQLEAVQNPDQNSFHLKTRLVTKYKQDVSVNCSISNLRDPLGTTLLTMAHFGVIDHHHL